jgi:DNA-directed RNA polymerase subunit RPC12/RpoP
MRTPYMCLKCGKMFATPQEMKSCNHTKDEDMGIEADKRIKAIQEKQAKQSAKVVKEKAKEE